MPLDVSRFRVRCRCGAAAEGPRLDRPQVVACPACRARLFVFPSGPRPPAAPPAAAPWRGPLVAAGLTALLLAVAMPLLMPYLLRRVQTPDLTATRGRVEAARKDLALGQFRRAAAALDGVAGLPAGEAREAAQLGLQAELLSRLSLLPLEELVRHARFAAGPEEWAGHRGRAVVFDDALRRDADGRPAFGRYALEVDGEPVRVALEDVTLLRDLPLDDGARVIFGVRLRACERERGGWAVRLEPDGVLFTDRPALEAACPVDLGPGLDGVLARQRGWLAARGR